MPRKTKDAVNNETDKIKQVSKTKKTSSNSSDKKSSTSKKSAVKKSTTESIPKKTTSSKTASSKKTTIKSKTTSSKKSSLQTVKTKSNVATQKKKSTKSSKKATPILEYYDLPYRYNETVVKILAQTPKKLFIYWDISDEDRNNYIKKFGNEFFNNTKPVLIVHNDSMNYTFEVEINDFANCWYLDVNDSKCKYTIELGRRSKSQNYYIPNNYMYVTSSNIIESPNDHILFEKQANTVYFRNVKNNITHSKNIANMSFITKIGKIYTIHDAYQKLYSKLYGNENVINGFEINNPSSGNPTSTFK